MASPPRLELLGAGPPMAPSEDPSTFPANQPRSRTTRRRARRPRLRRCLMKGCSVRFRPIHHLDRYCSTECTEEARQWSLWKARRKYRSSKKGKATRKAEHRRRREQIKTGKAATVVAKTSARVITRRFFRRLLRPTWVLRDLCAESPLAPAAVLLEGVPEGSRARSGAGAPMGGARSGARVRARMSQ